MAPTVKALMGKKQVYDFRRFEDSAFKWQPQLVIFSDIGPSIRWCGNENGTINNTNWNLLDTAGFKRGHGAPPTDTLNRGNVNGKHWMPAEADVSIRPGWFYHAKEDSKVKTPAALFNLYLRSVGNGGNLLLNVPPDRTGRINAADSASLVGFRTIREAAFAKDLLSKAKISTNSKNVSGLKNLTDNQIKTYWSSDRQNDTQLTFELPETVTINSVILEEMIQFGQRVSGFTIELMGDTKFEKVYSGTTIGRKKIARFEPFRTKKIRVTITDAKAAPVLRSITGYMMRFE